MPVRGEQRRQDDDRGVRLVLPEMHHDAGLRDGVPAPQLDGGEAGGGRIGGRASASDLRGNPP